MDGDEERREKNSTDSIDKSDTKKVELQNISNLSHTQPSVSEQTEDLNTRKQEKMEASVQEVSSKAETENSLQSKGEVLGREVHKSVHHQKHSTETSKIGISTKFTSWFTGAIKNPYNIAFLVILLLGFLIRLKYIGQESIWNDAAVHLWYAQKVLQEPTFFLSQQYLAGDYFTVQTIMAFLLLFIKSPFLVGKIVATVFSLIGIVFMYLLGSELKGKFAGLLAAGLLAFNHIFWFYSVRPLADSPMLVMTIILLYAMVKLEKTEEKKEQFWWGVASGTMFIVCLLTKVQSVLFIFALVIYYLLFKRKILFKDKAILVSWLIPVGGVFIAHIAGKLLFGRAVLDRVFGLFLTTRGIPYGLEATGMLKWVFSWYLIPFIIIGALFVIFYKRKEYYFGMILFIFYWAFFEINVDSTADRYVLPLLSVGIILAVFAIVELGEIISTLSSKKVGRILSVVVVLIIVSQFYSVGNALIPSKSMSYAGHQEAGEWLKKNVVEGTPIFAGSPRMLRAFVGRDFYQEGHEDSPIVGGSIYWLRHEKYKEDFVGDAAQKNFERDLAMLNKNNDIYLEIDIWEYTQPKWYWPIRQESFVYFASLGFELVHVVQRDLPTQEGMQNQPVIFIMKKARSESVETS